MANRKRVYIPSMALALAVVASLLSSCGQNNPTPNNVSPNNIGFLGVPSQALCQGTPGTILTVEGCLPQLNCPINNGVRSAYSYTQQQCIAEITGGVPPVIPPGGGVNAPLRFQSQLSISDQGVFREYLKRETRMCDPGIWNWGSSSCGSYAQSGYAMLTLQSYQIQYGLPGQLVITGGVNSNYGSLSRQMDVILRDFNSNGNRGYELKQISGWSFVSAQISHVDSGWNTIDITFFYQNRQFATARMFRY